LCDGLCFYTISDGREQPQDQVLVDVPFKVPEKYNDPILSCVVELEMESCGKAAAEDATCRKLSWGC
jgi:hypothetical protein